MSTSRYPRSVDGAKSVPFDKENAGKTRETAADVPVPV